MPVHDLGYHSWDGTRRPRFLRWVAITRSGLTMFLRTRWLKIFLLVGCLPALFPGVVIFYFEYNALRSPEQIGFLLEGPIFRPELRQSFDGDPTKIRHEVWSSAILALFRYPQLVAMVLLIGLVTPRLVSYDFRSRAFLQYFSRPLSPLEYVLGKSAVVWCFLAIITMLPALSLYVLGVFLSPDFSVLAATWDIPLGVFLAWILVAVPTTTLAMLYSSFTTESRYATFAWFTTWIVGFVAYQILTFAPVAGGPPPRRGRRGWEGAQDLVDLDRWRLVSPYHTLGKVQTWIFGLPDSSGSGWPALGLLIAITVIGTGIILWRVRSRLRV